MPSHWHTSPNKACGGDHAARTVLRKAKVHDAINTADQSTECAHPSVERHSSKWQQLKATADVETHRHAARLSSAAGVQAAHASIHDKATMVCTTAHRCCIHDSALHACANTAGTHAHPIAQLEPHARQCLCTLKHLGLNRSHLMQVPGANVPLSNLLRSMNEAKEQSVNYAQLRRELDALAAASNCFQASDSASSDESAQLVSAAYSQPPVAKAAPAEPSASHTASSKENMQRQHMERSAKVHRPLSHPQSMTPREPPAQSPQARDPSSQKGLVHNTFCQDLPQAEQAAKRRLAPLQQFDALVTNASCVPRVEVCCPVQIGTLQAWAPCSQKCFRHV